MKFALTISVRHKPRAFDFLGHHYVPYVQEIGIVPVVVPNVLDDPCAYVTSLGVEGLILTGGGDIEPYRYGQPNTASAHISPLRDETETRLLELAVERRWPVLGICRGMQVLNVFFGGGLVQNIASEVAGALAHDDEARCHAVTVVDERFESVLSARELSVNTHHHQGVIAANLAPPLGVFAVSEIDGIIEGVYHRALPILGVQWHPERATPSREFDLRLFRRFVTGAFWL